MNAFFDTELYSLLMIVCLWYAIDMDVVPEKKAYESSFFIYVVHILMFSIIKKIQYAVLPHTELYMVLSYLTVPLFALLVLIPLATVFKRGLPGAYRLLTGGR
jgi:fucose 4-O-acetylase-like acetyltransferase